MSCAVWCAARGATAERLTDVRHTRMVWSARAGGCRALRHCVAQRKCPGEASVTTAIAKPLAPVVIFAHRRPEHLRRTLASLMRCPGFEESPIIVYGDGPRRNDEREHVATTRRVAREMLGSRAEYHFRDANLGLDPSVICGVTEVVERFGRVIVIEDDLELAPGFLTYMNAALDRYAGESSVYQVSGYQIDVPEFAQRDGAMFLPFIVPWGWATWRRAWDQFDPLASGWTRLLTDKTMRRRFNVGGGVMTTPLCSCGRCRVWTAEHPGTFVGAGQYSRQMVWCCFRLFHWCAILASMAVVRMVEGGCVDFQRKTLRYLRSGLTCRNLSASMPGCTLRSKRRCSGKTAGGLPVQLTNYVGGWLSA